jgi:hypothetical protein
MLETLDAILQRMDQFAGFAALVNGMLLWPIVRTLKTDHAASKQHQDERLDNHEGRIAVLETK